MAKWLKFLSDVDYRHKSRAVTAYKAGMVCYVPNHIANSDRLKGKVEEVERPSDSKAIDPDEGDGRRVYIMDKIETTEAQCDAAWKAWEGMKNG